jgi:hypothetical protein
VSFAVLAGVPDDLPRAGSSVAWDALLGTPATGAPDDFAARDAGAALLLDTPAGAISMRPTVPDLECARGALPACRREVRGDAPAPDTCRAARQFAPAPARRLVEVARRFDQSRLCNGTPCAAGSVTSVCADPSSPADLRGGALGGLIDSIRSTLRGVCVPRPVRTSVDSGGNRAAECVMRAWMPVGRRCDAARGRTLALGAAGAPLTTARFAGGVRVACEVAQVPTRDERPVLAGRSARGWYYTRGAPHDSSCRQSVAFTPDAHGSLDEIDELVCVEAFSACVR